MVETAPQGPGDLTWMLLEGGRLNLYLFLLILDVGEVEVSFVGK